MDEVSGTERGKRVNECERGGKRSKKRRESVRKREGKDAYHIHHIIF